MSSNGDTNASEDVLASCRHDLNCLADPNKVARRRALERLSDILLGANRPGDGAISSPNGRRTVLLPIMKCMEDVMERCRELSIEIFTGIIQHIPSLCASGGQDAGILQFLIPVISNRIGQEEFNEPSEELRLLLVRLLALCIRSAGVCISTFIGDVSQIIQRSMKDNFPEVKKQCSNCIIELGHVLPASEPILNESMKLHSAALCKALVGSALHQHSRVRTSILAALGVVITRDPGPCLDLALPILQRLVADRTGSVRRQCFSMIPEWLRTMPDRVSFYRQLLPLALQGLADENEEIQQIVVAELDKLGAQYESEYVDELKDMLRYGDPAPIDDVALPVPTNGCVSMPSRPRLGMRAFVKSKFFEMIPAILKDTNEWVVDIRQRAVRLLYIVMRHAETAITQHVMPILTALTRMVDDDDKQIRAQVISVAELVGIYSPLDISLSISLPMISGAMGATIEQRRAGMSILTAILNGSGRLQSHPVDEHLLSLLLFVFGDEIINTEDTILRILLTDFVSSIFKNASMEAVRVHLKIGFAVLMSLYSVFSADGLGLNMSEFDQQSIKKIDEELLPLISHASSPNGNIAEIYSGQLIHSIVHDGILLSTSGESRTITCSKPVEWTSSSQELSLFCTVLRRAVYAKCEMTGIFGDIIPAVACRCSSGYTPDAVLVRLLTLIEFMISQSSLDTAMFQACRSADLIKNVVVPTMQWKPGRVATECRRHTIGTLLALLENNLLSNDHLNVEQKDLIQPLASCLDDNEIVTRMNAMLCSKLLMKQCGPEYTGETVFSEVVKRLDDSHDPLRIEAAKVLEILLPSLSQEQFSSLVRSLLLHMDDMNCSVQETVCSVLKTAASIHGDIVKTEVTAARHVHRSSQYCDMVLDSIS